MYSVKVGSTILVHKCELFKLSFFIWENGHHLILQQMALNGGVFWGMMLSEHKTHYLILIVL